MLPRDKKAYSKIRSIAHISSLAGILDIPESELVEISCIVDTLWKPGKILKKKSGELRPTIDAKPSLKSLHEKIKTRLLKQVTYPSYLLGGIADSMTPRDYKRHASLHSGKSVLITEDIKDFFPSTSEIIISAIWKRFFCFSPEVAKILTRITTLNNSLPQGWKTSGYLANLAFWDSEPNLVATLSRNGFTYSRFMDDITVSCNFALSNRQKQFVISLIYGMLFSKGYKPKRTKHHIVSPNARMEVTGLTVNGKIPSLSPIERNKIRAQVHMCEVIAKRDKQSKSYKKMWGNLSGKVGTLSRFHPREGKQLRERLTAIKPLKARVT